MRKTLLWMSLFLLAGHTQDVHAEPQAATVTWRVSDLPLAPILAGETIRVKLLASIAPGWHVYALDEPEGGPIPTTIGLSDGDPATLLHVDEGQPEEVLDPAFHQRTKLFRKRAQFSLKLHLDRGFGTHSAYLHVLIRYQACSKRVCSPPRTDAVAVKLPRNI